MADDENASLKEFAGIIQEKAGPIDRESRQRRPAEIGHERSGPEALAGLPSMLEVRPRMLIAGIAAGIGVAVGYVLGKLGRR